MKPLIVPSLAIALAVSGVAGSALADVAPPGPLGGCSCSSSQQPTPAAGPLLLLVGLACGLRRRTLTR